MENGFFTHFLSHLPGLLSFYKALQHPKIWGWGEGRLDPGLGVLSSLEGRALHTSLEQIYLVEV